MQPGGCFHGGRCGDGIKINAFETMLYANFATAVSNYEAAFKQIPYLSFAA